jgi:DNA polymerase-1
MKTIDDAPDRTGSDSTDNKAAAALPGHLAGYANLAPEHAQELLDSAIPALTAADQGVRSAHVRDDLPAWAGWIADKYGDDVFPCLVYPMVHPDGSETGQVKPAPRSVTNDSGRTLKYVSPGRADTPPQLPVLRAVQNPEVVLIVEGVKQALAALAWAPETWSIYRITGIWSWRVADDGKDDPGTPTPHLAVVQGRKVVIVPDADAKTNILVFDGATALGEACEAYGASSVKFARIPGAGKDGLDDLLVRLPNDDARRSMLLSWVAKPHGRPADLDKREQKAMRNALDERRAAERSAAPVTAPDGRTPVDVGGDQRQASLDLLDALVECSGGVLVFQRGAELVRVRRAKDGKGADGPLGANTLSRSELRRELLDVTYPYTVSAKGPAPAGIPDSLIDIVADHYDRLPWLTAITRSPLVLADGTVLTESGYHAASGVYLDLTPDVQGIQVPDYPSDTDITEAVSLLCDDLFAMDGADGYDGWAFARVADQTSAIAGLITPVIRAVVRKVPMLLFDGLHRGVGKNGCLDVIHRVAFGAPAPIQTTPKSDEEMDKRITAKLRASADTVCLDEVQDDEGSRLTSNALGAALTSEIYESRKLGSSEMLSLPQTASWYGLGNNIEIPGDMVRRVYTCRMASDRDDLETRDNFRHDLDTWVPEHRAELLRAVLVLVRAWYARGCPAAPRAFGFKSFTEWQHVVGGILHLAGIRGFLSTVLEVRESADSEFVDNSEHWGWVESLFPAGSRFGASAVLAQAKADRDAPPPYGKSWEELDARKLSMYYGQHPRWYDGLRVREDGKLHGKGKAYVVDRLPAGVAALQGAQPNAARTSATPRQAAGAAPGELIDFTGRGGFKQQAARAMPPINGKTIAELDGDAS